jgi:low temperature requirement protein LtrA
MGRLGSHLRLRTPVDATAERKVTWLELFFDLVFVAAVSQVAEPLREHYTLTELTRFTPLFLLVWWAWTGRAVFSTRFDTDDSVQRTLTFFEMFAVAVMAANARDSLASRSSAGFAAAYAGVRVILLIHYLRATGIREARGLTLSYVIGHGTAAALWLASSIVPVDLRIVMWVAACAIDLGTPWAAIDHSVRVPPHPGHLPERFGLFTLILLGESVVAVMKGIESQETWSIPAASSALVGLAGMFGIWWWYFDRARVAAERHVRTRRDAIRLHLWSYAHFPLYLGIVILGVGIRRLVTVATHSVVPQSDVLMWIAATVLLTGAMGAIAALNRPAAARAGRGRRDGSHAELAEAQGIAERTGLISA